MRDEGDLVLVDEGLHLVEGVEDDQLVPLAHLLVREHLAELGELLVATEDARVACLSERGDRGLDLVDVLEMATLDPLEKLMVRPARRFGLGRPHQPPGRVVRRPNSTSPVSREQHQRCQHRR